MSISNIRVIRAGQAWSGNEKGGIYEICFDDHRSIGVDGMRIDAIGIIGRAKGGLFQ